MATMQATFALISMQAALEKRPFSETIRVQPSPRLDQMISRFTLLQKGWIECQKHHSSDFPELEELFHKTEVAMNEAALLVSDLKHALRKRPSITLERARIAQLFMKTRKAIRAGQKITHKPGFETRKIPLKPPGATSPPEEWFSDYNERKKQNRRANALADRRKRPLQCCMFVAVAFSQMLDENDMLAEYESEIVGECFDRALTVDDGLTYQWTQMRHHSTARLLPPPERYPRWWVHEGQEDDVVPCMVRNPLPVGAPVVTNQLCPGAKYEKDYINLNRNNVPQDFTSAHRQQPPDRKRKR